MRQFQSMTPPSPAPAAQQGVSSLLAPYQAAIAAAPTDVTTTDPMARMAQIQGITAQAGGTGTPVTGANGPLKTINGVTMVAPAMRSLAQARQQLGLPIFGNVVSSYRTREQQQRLWQAYQNGTGNMAAKPGTSNHETGHAVDIASSFLSAHPDLRSWLLQHGWTNDVPGEPWHWQYGV
jgi:D-alanyl-D-alanine carboxypeptidase